MKEMKLLASKAALLLGVVLLFDIFAVGMANKGSNVQGKGVGRVMEGRKSGVRSRGRQRHQEARERTASRRLGKGGKGGKGKGSGSGSGYASGAWMDGMYWGCLALSGSDQYQVKSHHKNVPQCGFTVHYDDIANTQTDTDYNQYDGAYNGDNNQGEAAEENGGQGDGDQGENENQNEGNGGAGDEISSAELSQIMNGTTEVEVTGVNDIFDPFLAFNITECDTYEGLWTWDVMMTCGEGTDSDVCICMFAEILMEEGHLTCKDGASCPQGCPICNNCLVNLGCENVPVGTIASGTGNSLTIIAAAAFTLLFGVGFCLLCKGRHKKKDGGKLGAHLMESDPSFPGGEKIWGIVGSSVWLAPDDASTTSSSSAGRHINQRKAVNNAVSTRTLNMSTQWEASIRRLRTRETDVKAAKNALTYVSDGLGKAAAMMPPAVTAFPDLLPGNQHQQDHVDDGCHENVTSQAQQIGDKLWLVPISSGDSTTSSVQPYDDEHREAGHQLSQAHSSTSRSRNEESGQSSSLSEPVSELRTITRSPSDQGDIFSGSDASTLSTDMSILDQEDSSDTPWDCSQDSIQE